MIRPRRSLLFMPGSNARALEKARNLPADCIILDLEDAVAPDAKAMARDQIALAIAAKGFGRREVLIRVNALDSPWWIDDVTMAGKAKPDGILVPKISSVEDLSAIADRLTNIGAVVASLLGDDHLWIHRQRIEAPAACCSGRKSGSAATRKLIISKFLVRR